MTVRLDQMSLLNLTYAKLPTSKNNIVSLIAWACGENNSTNIESKASWNPWDTEERMPGSTDFNKAGVQDYPNAVVGMQAWAKTLNNGHYASIIHCLKQSADPQTTLEAIAGTPWGYAVDKTILPTILSNFDHYASLPVGGSEDGTTVSIDNETITATTAEQSDGIEAAPVAAPAPVDSHVTPTAAEATAESDLKEGDNVLSALQAQLTSYVASSGATHSALAAKMRTHISELEAIATALEALV